MSPVVLARRRLVRLLGNKEAAKLCFDVVAPRFVDRAGGYTRIMRLAMPRLGDAGTRRDAGIRGRPRSSRETGRSAENRKRTSRLEKLISASPIQSSFPSVRSKRTRQLIDAGCAAP